MNWLLIVVVAILAVNTLIGMKAGFIKTIFSLCSMVVAILLTLWISPMVGDFMKSNQKIYNAISSKVEKMLPFSENEADTNNEESMIKELRLPKSIQNSMIKNNNEDIYSNLDVEIGNFKGYVNSYLTGMIINALSFILTFIVILVLLWVICIALDIVSKLPLLNQLNKTAGLVAGLLHGLVVVWLFFILVTVFQSTGLGQQAMEMIYDSQVLSLIYNNNLLLKFVTSIKYMMP